ncbi:MAG TPA: hypothetical protein DEB17_11065 [Chlorobaculum sp.]|uniref:Uncharacterized protein n=1 Tax=Chlorobaculum tepidum (strain ATCC 49652 / DSM 12025 / NBRC 103806 / TLS) TaxID=194439 RepID=Q8KCL1_CHLTE|nr:hypothetical protein CT1404 [Chlorobaculum tepidum TLS]HBU24509.1 hypothetical protein [Chlorobaculum sp.]
MIVFDAAKRSSFAGENNRPEPVIAHFSYIGRKSTAG